ncbi:MAG: hypothetical protein RMI91_13380 [Gemmatales bacterium]|nr:hypothetical protein [Gemmatales bacterium]MDW7995637.1 hypothetical protein [Gemmatales bacterium]
MPHWMPAVPETPGCEWLVTDAYPGHLFVPDNPALSEHIPAVPEPPPRVT